MNKNRVSIKIFSSCLAFSFIMIGISGCNINTEIPESSSSSNPISSTQIIGNQTSLGDDLQETSSTSPPLLKLNGTNNYRFIGSTTATDMPTYAIGVKCYQLVDVSDEKQLDNILSIISNLTLITDIGYDNYKAGGVADLSRHILGIASGKDRKNVIPYDDPRTADWDEKYPKTETYFGSSSNYLEKKYVDQAINEYFCADCKNIIFDGLEYYYLKYEDVYSLPTIGREVNTLPILLSFAEHDSTYETVFSFAHYSLYANGNDLLIDDNKSKDNMAIGHFKIVTAEIPDLCSIDFTQPYISPQNREKLNPVKFKFCKDKDNLKIHSIEFSK